MAKLSNELLNLAWKCCMKGSTYLGGIKEMREPYWLLADKTDCADHIQFVCSLRKFLELNRPLEFQVKEPFYQIPTSHYRRTGDMIDRVWIGARSDHGGVEARFEVPCNKTR